MQVISQVYWWVCKKTLYNKKILCKENGTKIIYLARWHKINVGDVILIGDDNQKILK